MKPTQISITIDTEGSIGGAFAEGATVEPVGSPAIDCMVNGKSNGVGFMLDLFRNYNIKATFFVECANYYYFGDHPMRDTVVKIMEAGQDVQLHVHPCWLHYIDDPELGGFSQNDNCYGRDYGELKRIFELSIDVFERCLLYTSDAADD